MKKKILSWLIALSALSVSSSAAFYSVSGLGKMFAGAGLQVMILAGSLEFAKLVIASLLYQYWKELNKWLKIYLSISTVILVLITSAGIYGFLSSAYQETAYKLKNQGKNIEILDKNISIIQNEIENTETQIKQKNNRLGQLTNIRSNLQGTQDVLISQSKSTKSIRKQITDIESEIKRIDKEVSVYNDSISSKNSRISSIEIDKLAISSNEEIAKEIGPLKYISDLTGKSLDQVVNWYIIVLMLVFDPLAISLVIAANFAFEMNKDDKKEEINKKENNKEGEESGAEEEKIIEEIDEEKKSDIEKEATEEAIEETIEETKEEDSKTESQENITKDEKIQEITDQKDDKYIDEYMKKKSFIDYSDPTNIK